MKNRIKRLGVGLLAAFMVAVFVLVPAQLDAPQAAFALCYPPSTINPACQPQNIPILIDAGVISGGGATSTTAATAGGAAAGPGVASLLVNGAAGTAGFLGLWLWLTGQSGGDGKAHGVAGLNGVSGLKFDTDPSYVGGAPKGCLPTPGVPGFLLPRVLSTTSWPPSISGGNYVPTNPASSFPRNCIMPAEITAYNSAGGNTHQFRVTLSAALAPTINTLVVSSGASYAKWALIYLCKTGGTNRLSSLVINSTGSNFQATGNAGWFNPCGSAVDTEQVALWYMNQTGAWVTGTLYNSATTVTNLPLADNNIRGQIRTTITCRPTGGGADITVVVPGSVNAVPGETVAVPDALCPVGYINIETEIDFQKPNETTWAPLIESAPTPDEITELPVLYPDCFPPSTKTCEMTLWKITTTGLDWCGQNGELCNGWAQQPNARDNYECRYGDYTIEIDRCSAFRYPDVGKLPNFTEDGDPIPIEAPKPVPLPGEVVDPVTGTPIPIPVPSPEVQPGTTNCYPTGWGALNPISWVVQPVQCALQWAFVPKASTVNNVWQRIGQSWQRWGLVKLTTAVTAWEFIPPGGGCSGVTVSMGWLVASAPEAKFFNACPGEPMAPYAFWVKILLTLAIVLAGVQSVTTSVAGLVQFKGLGD